MDFLTTHSQFNCRHYSSSTNLHFNQLLHAINCFTPSADFVTLIYDYFIEFPLAIQKWSPPSFSNIFAIPLIHLHKELYDSIYCQCPTMITLMYQPACPLWYYLCTSQHASIKFFNSAAATLTFIYHLPTMSPPRIGTSTTPLLLKHTQSQQLLAAAILHHSKWQPLATLCLYCHRSYWSLYLHYCYSNY